MPILLSFKICVVLLTASSNLQTICIYSTIVFVGLEDLFLQQVRNVAVVIIDIAHCMVDMPSHLLADLLNVKLLRLMGAHHLEKR